MDKLKIEQLYEIESVAKLLKALPESERKELEANLQSLMDLLHANIAIPLTTAFKQNK